MAKVEVERLLTVSEVASTLGLAEVTIRMWISQRRIEHVRVGLRAVRIPATVIQKIIQDGTIPTKVGLR